MTDASQRNLSDRPDVGPRLAGREHRGPARVLTDADGRAIDLLRLYLEQQRMTARALHIARDDAELRTADLRRVLDDTVVVEPPADGPLRRQPAPALLPPARVVGQFTPS